MSTFDDGYGRQTCSRALSALAARQHAVVSLAQLRLLGLGARGTQHRAALGKLHRVHGGVYAVGHPLLTPDGHRMAAVLACGPGAFLSLRSAAAAWGLRRTSRTSVEVTTTRRGCRPKPGIDVQHVRASPRRHHHAPWHPDHLGRAYPELDGAAAHHTARAFEDDRRRDAAMTACGYAVVRLTWRRVMREGSAVAEELRRMLAPRGAAAAP